MQICVVYLVFNLCQAGYVLHFTFECLFLVLCKNYMDDIYQTAWRGVGWTKEKTITFLGRSSQQSEKYLFYFFLDLAEICKSPFLLF